MLFEAIQIVENIKKVNFVFADAHGGIKLRLHEPHKGQQVWLFYLIDELNKLLTEMM